MTDNPDPAATQTTPFAAAAARLPDLIHAVDSDRLIGVHIAVDGKITVQMDRRLDCLTVIEALAVVVPPGRWQFDKARTGRLTHYNWETDLSSSSWDRVNVGWTRPVRLCLIAVMTDTERKEDPDA